MSNRTARRAMGIMTPIYNRALGWNKWEPATPEQMAMAPAGMLNAWKNNLYVVQLYRQPSKWGMIDHLMVRRNDAAAVRDWTHMQRIKNEIMGPDRVAVEVYPASGDVVDDRNIYHLWVLPAGSRLPFGLHDEENP